MDKHSDPPPTSRRRFFRQFLASAVEGVEDLGRSLNEAKRELEAQRRHWYESSTPDRTHWRPPERYGPPWPPPAGPPIPRQVRQSLRQKQQHFYEGEAIPHDDAPID